MWQALSLGRSGAYSVDHVVDLVSWRLAQVCACVVRIHEAGTTLAAEAIGAVCGAACWVAAAAVEHHDTLSIRLQCLLQIEFEFHYDFFPFAHFFLFCIFF